MTDTDDNLTDEIGYADAMSELTRILATLETADVDVDLLADNVARASELIELCRNRIVAAEMSVEKIVDSVETES